MGASGQDSVLRPHLDDTTYDPEKAKALLAEAGQSHLTFDMFFTPGVSDRAAEVVQAQWPRSA